ncbi:MAG: HyaD/HybD family hydrogenase maturation endopeptidase [Dehalococcoidia bacterium]|nr:HyaD/HybD family hydrogenase maturation endopeptidase [Dehalococcoidia bacterium]MDH4299656.1 HyaD/HybD family hydrogenase maturation endopeptidase [Dehalococcoidia bacterium]MDH4367338.1 HyaD/HybD family hydrogenase maturation endopeptidase [Dehalococcoidia bacterium]
MAKFVVGIGNVLLKDEGIGCHVVRALEEVNLSDVEVIDGGTCLDVLQLSRNADKLIIVDAVKGGGMPGQIYRFHIEDVTLEKKALLSLHDMSLVDTLKLMQLWHNIDEAVIIGVEPKDIDWGLELSPELREKIPQITDAILAELNNKSPKGEMKC